MKHLLIPDAPEGPRRLIFYLAVEEWLAGRGEDAFFTWHTRPTIIYGHNQNPAAEFDAEYCRLHGIEAYRRKSGGGCVYSDSGNLMVSRILTRKNGKNVETVFSEYLSCVAAALGNLGLEAVVTDHNDVLVAGRKVSGNAFFRTPKADIVHGTLLYSSDFEVMTKALTPPETKLLKHGVQSVRQRVANLNEFTSCSFAEVEKAVQLALADNAEIMTLSVDDILQIEKIEESFLDIL